MNGSAVNETLPSDSPTRRERVHRPAFTWWPWRALSFLVPFVALIIGAMVYMQTEQNALTTTDDRNAPLMVIFTLWAAGNAFLVGMAIGDMGKTLVTVFISVFAANVVVIVMQEASALIAPPIIVGITCATLALEWTVEDMLAAMVVGLQAMFVGAIFGAVACVPTTILLAIFLKDTGVAIGLGLGVCVGNVGLIRHLFSAAQRVQDPTLPDVAPPPPKSVPEVAPTEADLKADRDTSRPPLLPGTPAAEEPKDMRTLDFE